ncbi:MAG TPA: squalene synthase HpnD [Bacteroidetes bacterium]|nr:squalene synthase HpnD [Bacteroidota bacterium]
MNGNDEIEKNLQAPPPKKISLQEGYLYCRNLTKRTAKNFYFAFLFLPWLKRRAIYAVYAFCRYADDLVDDPKYKDKSLLLEKWRQDLEKCYRGEYGNNKILIALHDTVKRFHIPKEYFIELIDGMQMDLSVTRYETFEELYKYAYRAASVVGLICVEIFGYRNATTKEYAENLGIALQLTNIIRDVKEDAQRGRIYLPLEDLDRFQYTESELLSGKYVPSFIQLMEYQAARALYYYEKAASLIPKEDRTLLSTAEIMKNIYFHLLLEIKLQGYDVFKRRISASRVRKLYIASITWLKIHIFRK